MYVCMYVCMCVCVRVCVCASIRDLRPPPIDLWMPARNQSEHTKVSVRNPKEIFELNWQARAMRARVCVYECVRVCACVNRVFWSWNIGQRRVDDLCIAVSIKCVANLQQHAPGLRSTHDGVSISANISVTFSKVIRWLLSLPTTLTKVSLCSWLCSCY